MPAYWIGEAKVNDPASWKEFGDKSVSAFVRHGGKVLARGGVHKVLEGTDDDPRLVIVEFASTEAAEACFNSSEYREAAAYRQASGAGELRITIISG